MSNKYYDWWKSNKPLMALVPAIVFWLVSMIFFVVGLKFNNPILIFGTDISMAIAIALTVSNTLIQIIGNEQEAEGMGTALWIGWIASYILGIGTNIVGLLSILDIANSNLEWGIAFGLGTIIEVLPERLLVLFLKTWEGHNKKPQNAQRPAQTYNPSNPAMNRIPKKPVQRPPWETSQSQFKPSASKKTHPYLEPTYHDIKFNSVDDDEDLRFMS